MNVERTGSAAALAGAICLGACTVADGSLPRATVSDSTGVRIVENRGSQWVGDDRWTVSREPSVTIGVLDGDAEYQLYTVAAVTRQSDGTIVLIDGSRRVRRYGATGGFLGEFGGEGSGPGEFIDPEVLLIGPGDSIDVGDVRLSRVTRFSPTGGLAGTRTLDLPAVAEAIGPTFFPYDARPLPGERMLVRFADGTGKGSGKVAALKGPGDAVEGVIRPPSGAAILASDFVTIESRFEFAGGELSPLPAAAGSVPVPPAQAKQAVIAADPRGSRVCVGDQARPEVTCLTNGGSTIIRWETLPAPVTEGEIEDWIVTTTATWAGKMSDDEARKLLEEVVQPTERPAYLGLMLDHVGNLWVEQNPPDRGEADPISFLVFDPDGTQLGEIVLPPLDVKEIGIDYVLGVHRDELGVEYVRQHTLVKPGG
jgi:hypothetical protein